MIPSDFLVLIPAAGYGVRVGRPESKEMLKRPGSHVLGFSGASFSGSPLIEEPIRRAWDAGAAVLVITREEKKSLIRYLEDLKAESPGRELQVQLVPPTKDWPDTLLASAPYWRKWNCVVLPDTEYEPRDMLSHISNLALSNFNLSDFNLSDFNLIVAQHQVQNLSTWGVIQLANDSVRLCEKPQSTAGLSHSDFAWGLYAFKKELGEKLLRLQSESSQDHQWKELKGVKAKELRLKSFMDLGRGD